MATKPLKKSAHSDLGALALRETSTVILYHPADYVTDTGYRVEIKSIYSDEAKAVIQAQADKNEAEQPPRVEGEPEPKDTSFTDSLPEQVIAVTVRWWKEGESTDTITLNGEVLRASPENVRRVYDDPQFRWIRNAVQAHYLGRANFFGASSGS